MVFLHKNIRLHPSKYEGMHSYFITLCCAARRPVFADSNHASWIIAKLAHYAIEHGFAVHAYCVMPDHLHALVMGRNETANLLTFLKAFKQKTGHDFLKTSRHDLWQKKYYDHVLRQGDSVSRVANYIWMNPVRKGLCAAPHQYPYSGSLTLDWKKETAPAESWSPPWKKKQPA